MNTIEFPCAKCGKRMQAPAEYAGRQVRCKSCLEQMTVPAVSQPLATSMADVGVHGVDETPVLPKQLARKIVLTTTVVAAVLAAVPSENSIRGRCMLSVTLAHSGREPRPLLVQSKGALE